MSSQSQINQEEKKDSARFNPLKKMWGKCAEIFKFISKPFTSLWETCNELIEIFSETISSDEPAVIFLYLKKFFTAKSSRPNSLLGDALGEAEVSTAGADDNTKILKEHIKVSLPLVQVDILSSKKEVSLNPKGYTVYSDTGLIFRPNQTTINAGDISKLKLLLKNLENIEKTDIKNKKKLEKKIQKKIVNYDYGLDENSVKILGAGAFGVVFLIVHSKKHYAIKAVDSNDTSVKNEIKALKKLRHGNIISLNFAFCHENTCYLVMPVMALSLEKFRKKNKQIVVGQQKSKELFLKILSGIIFLHQKEYVHNDIKLANILVSENLDDVRIADFGLVSKRGRLIGRRGTCSYLPPEKLSLQSGQKIYSEFWHDLYSFGILIFKFFADQESSVLSDDQKNEDQVIEGLVNASCRLFAQVVSPSLKKETRSQQTAQGMHDQIEAISIPFSS